jgi:hypothetical protein
MTSGEIERVVLEVLRESQTLSGRAWTDLEPTAKPIGDLDGFDSLAGVEATVMLEEKLGCRDLEADSVFVSENGKRALTVKQIAERIANLLAARGGNA